MGELTGLELVAERHRHAQLAERLDRRLARLVQREMRAGSRVATVPASAIARTVASEAYSR